MGRTVLHIDMDAFFASVEAQRRGLEDEPLAVCVFSGRTDDSGVVSTASYAARELGIEAAMPITRAKDRAAESSRQVHFVPMDREYYREVSDRIREQVLEPVTETIEQASIDEFYLDITDGIDERSEAVQLAERIQQEVRQGFDLSCSIGVGPNRLVAKIASDQDKPDGLTVIRPEDVDAFMRSLSIEEIHGIGPKTAQRLSDLGIDSVEELASADRARLVEEFGEDRGIELWEKANGRDDSPVEEEPPKQLSRLTTLDADTRDRETIGAELPELADAVMERLQEADRAFQQVAVIVIDAGITTRTRSRTLETPVQDRELLLETARELLTEWLDENDEAVRRIGVRAADLTDAGGQTSLDAF